MKNLLTCCISTLLICTLSTSWAQTDKTTAAFTTSYEKEYKKEYAAALASMKEVYDTKSYELNLRMGWLSYEAGQNKESMGYYQLATDLMPYAIEAKLGMTYPAYALGNTTLLLSQYEKILAIDPQNTTANYKLGLIYYDKKDYAAANKYFEKVVNLYPFTYDALLMYAWTNYRLGKNREAKVLFTKVLWLYPTDKSALEGVGLIK